VTRTVWRIRRAEIIGGGETRDRSIRPDYGYRDCDPNDPRNFRSEAFGGQQEENGFEPLFTVKLAKVSNSSRFPLAKKSFQGSNGQLRITHRLKLTIRPNFVAAKYLKHKVKMFTCSNLKGIPFKMQRRSA